MSFKITNNLQSAANIAKVVYANQQPAFTTDVDDEIAYFKDGTLTSSAGLTYDGVTLGTDARISAEDRIQVNSTITAGSFLAMASEDNSSYIDFGSTGPTGPALDARIISFAPNPAFPANKNLAVLNPSGGDIQLLGPVRIGLPIAPAFKLDYGSVVLPGALNAQVPVVFTVGMFTTNPFVYLTVVSPITTEANAQPVFVESLTPTGCNVQFIGMPSSTAPGTFCNWLALGI